MKDKYCSIVRAAHRFTRRATLPALFGTAAFALNTTAIAQGGPVWYNGDWNFVGFHANEINTSSSNSQVFDDFNVIGGPLWHVTAVFSDNLLSTVVTGADWEIRTGCSVGNLEGVLVASGSTATPVVTATGRSGFGFNEYMVEVTGLNVFLPALPSGQHYWLNVTPVGNGTGRSFNSTTSGANCIGSPCGNDGMSWFRPGVMFSPDDFSMGVISDLVPEPATWALLGGGLGILLVAARWRRSHSRKN